MTPRADAQVDKWFNSSIPHRRALLAINGILQGIFDFDSISLSELKDNLETVVRLGINLIMLRRNTHLNLDVGDEIIGRVRETIGISPYMIITQAAILHNKQILTSAESEIKKFMASDASKPSLQKMEETRKFVAKKIDEEYLPNIFNYVVESTLMEEGLRQCHAGDRKGRLRQQLTELKDRISDTHEKLNRAASGLNSVLLVFLEVVAKPHKHFLNVIMTQASWKKATNILI